MTRIPGEKKKGSFIMIIVIVIIILVIYMFYTRPELWQNVKNLLGL